MLATLEKYKTKKTEALPYEVICPTAILAHSVDDYDECELSCWVAEVGRFCVIYCRFILEKDSKGKNRLSVERRIYDKDNDCMVDLPVVYFASMYDEINQEGLDFKYSYVSLEHMEGYDSITTHYRLTLVVRNLLIRAAFSPVIFHRDFMHFPKMLRKELTLAAISDSVRKVTVEASGRLKLSTTN